MKRMIVFFTVVFSIITLFVGYNLFTVQKFQKFYVNKILKPGSGFSSKTGDIEFSKSFLPYCCDLPNLPKALLTSEELYNAKNLNNHDVFKLINKLPLKQCQPAISKAYLNFQQQIKKAPFSEKAPSVFDISAARPDLRKVREVSNLMAQLGRYYALLGLGNKSIKALLSAFAIPSIIIAENHKAYTLYTHIVLLDLFVRVSKAIIFSAEALRLTKPKVLRLNSSVQKLYKQFPSLSYSLIFVRNHMLSIGHTYELQASHLIDKNLPNYAQFFNKIHEVQRTILKEQFDPYLPNYEKSWVEGHLQVEEFSEHLLNYQAAHSINSSSQMFIGAFSPKHVLANSFYLLGMPNIKRSYKKTIEVRQYINGSMAVASLYAYKNEKGVYPSSLGQLKKWIKLDVFKDEFTDKQLNFSKHPIKIFSSGPDGKNGTHDDIILLSLE